MTQTAMTSTDRMQRAVMGQVFALYPQRLTLAELMRDLMLDLSDWSEKDVIKEAVRELVRAGVLHPLGKEEFVEPTRAALYLYELEVA